jgi:hypothetical protein
VIEPKLGLRHLERILNCPAMPLDRYRAASVDGSNASFTRRELNPCPGPRCVPGPPQAPLGLPPTGGALRFVDIWAARSTLRGSSRSETFFSAPCWVSEPQRGASRLVCGQPFRPNRLLPPKTGFHHGLFLEKTTASRDLPCTGSGTTGRRHRAWGRGHGVPSECPFRLSAPSVEPRSGCRSGHRSSVVGPRCHARLLGRARGDVTHVLVHATVPRHRERHVYRVKRRAAPSSHRPCVDHRTRRHDRCGADRAET